MEANESTQIPEEVPSPISNERPSSSNFNKLKYIAIGILILMVGLVGGIYFSRNLSETPNIESSTQSAPIPTSTTSISSTSESDEMEGWNTYVNEEYGFSVKYPESWQVQNWVNMNTGPGDNVPSSATIEFSKQGPDFTLAVQVLDNPEQLSLESFFTKWVYECCHPGETYKLPDAVKNAKTIVVSGIKGRELFPPIDTVGFAVKWVLINKDGKIYKISISSAQSYSESETELFFSKFLSAFEFVD